MDLPDLKTAPSATQDAIEEALRAARRAIRQGMHDLEDLRDAAALRVRHSPFKAVGLALGVGLVLGGAAVWATGVLARRR